MVELMVMLYTLAFGAPFKNKLEHGVHSLHCHVLVPEVCGQKQELIGMHEILHEGSPPMTDILDLKAARRISMPMKESQMLHMMQAFGVLLAVAIGTSSSLYKACKKDVIDSHDAVQHKLESLAELHPQAPVYAQVLCKLQLCLQECWTKVEVEVGQVDPPNFKMLFKAIKYKQSALSQHSIGLLAEG
jgi:hypothetical protein